MPTNNPHSEDFAKVRGALTWCRDVALKRDLGDGGYAVACGNALVALSRIEAQATREAEALEAAEREKRWLACFGSNALPSKELDDALLWANRDEAWLPDELLDMARERAPKSKCAEMFTRARTSTEHPATTSERCPTCGSDDPKVQRHLSVSDVWLATPLSHGGSTPCPDPFHTSEERSGE